MLLLLSVPVDDPVPININDNERQKISNVENNNALHL